MAVVEKEKRKKKKETEYNVLICQYCAADWAIVYGWRFLFVFVLLFFLEYFSCLFTGADSCNISFKTRARLISLSDRVGVRFF